MPPVKDFDKDLARTARLKPPAERTFRVNGVDLVHRPAVGPEDVSEFHAYEPADGEARLIEVLDGTMERILEPGSVSAWRSLRKPGGENPVTAWDMLQIVSWAVGAVSGRPTEESTDSSPSSPQNGTPSMADSGDRPVVAFGD